MSSERVVLHGIAASPGVATGRVTVFDRRSVPIPRRHIAEDELDAEVERLEAALEDSRREVEVIRDGLGEEGGEDHRLLLETQMLMLGDELLSRAAAEAIRADGINAEWALRRTVDDMRARLRRATEPYFRERAEDVGHVGEHVLRVLTGRSRSMPDISEPAILVASDLSPAEAAQLAGGQLLALVTDAGSASSHTAILARSLRVPAVVGVTDVTRRVAPGDALIVDGLRGEVILAAGSQEVAAAEARAARFRAFEGRLEQRERRVARTLDGVLVELHANVEIEPDVERAIACGVDGIGLYRTEFLYLDRLEPPGEEEQAALYSRVARRMAPRPVTFRTFDLGADKMPRGMRRSPNPALGLRALRVAFEDPGLFVTQLRALLRAASEGNVRVMFPMVSTVSDMRRARALLERARAELDVEGVPHGRPPIGAMLEVPSAVLLAERLASECDFFSLGTNDLAQYTLAVDRSDPRVAHLGSALEPAVLRLADRARRVAGEAGIPVGVCGDLASDPVAAPLLVGLGYTSLSMRSSAVPLVSEVISRLDGAKLAELASGALEQDGAAGVERLIDARLGADLGDLWEERGIELPRAP